MYSRMSTMPIVAKTATIATTTISSTSVKPRAARRNDGWTGTWISLARLLPTRIGEAACSAMERRAHATHRRRLGRTHRRRLRQDLLGRHRLVERIAEAGGPRKLEFLEIPARLFVQRMLRALETTQAVCQIAGVPDWFFQGRTERADAKLGVSAHHREPERCLLA